MSQTPNGQTFWLGAMSALAVVFFLLFVGVITDKVLINFDGSKKADVAAKKDYAAPAPADEDADTEEPAAPGVQVEPLSDDDWVRGDRDAAVTVVEFSDIDCPFCSRFHESMNQLIAKYDGQVNWVYRDFPLDGLHPVARDKAIAAECVGKIAGNDAYWQYLDGLFASSNADEINTEAAKLGIDTSAFTECQADPAIAAEVADDEKQGAAAGARGTPYSVIIAGDKKVPVNGALPLSQLESMIEDVLAE